MREPNLGVAIGMKSIGKTHETILEIRKVVTGYGGLIQPRRVLILDVNSEFDMFKTIALPDIQRFVTHPIIEARRVIPVHPGGAKMTTDEICEVLMFILSVFRGGLLLIEDINKYLTFNFPKDVVGAICTNRHIDLDIIMHYQSISKVPGTVWDNANWLRFHKIQQGVARYRDKYEDRLEMFSIAETLIDVPYYGVKKEPQWIYLADKQKWQYTFFVTCDLDNNKIRGNFTRGYAEYCIDEYLTRNYNRTIKTETDRRDFQGEKLYKNTESASLALRSRLLTDYFVFPSV